MGNVEEYRRLTGPRLRSLRHDKQQWMEQVATTGDNHLLCGEIKDDFVSFRQLKQKCATSSAPLKALDGKLLSDRASVAARWQEHFSTLLNRSTQSPPDALVSEAQASMLDSTSDTFPPTIIDVYKVMNKIKAGKAKGVCGSYTILELHARNDDDNNWCLMPLVGNRACTTYHYGKIQKCPNWKSLENYQLTNGNLQHSHKTVVTECIHVCMKSRFSKK